MLKPIGIGTEIFHELIESNSYYVDKTSFISTVFEKNTSKVMIITRPRRFGKTLTMSTFYDFLSLDPENPGDTSRQEKWFKDTDILKEDKYKDFCSKCMGKFPVVYITLKQVDGDDFISAYKQLASVVYNMYSKTTCTPSLDTLQTAVNWLQMKLKNLTSILIRDILKILRITMQSRIPWTLY